ncbi:MAG: hypothetical protein CVU65_16710, partial [Deltaproteobacteria bacterium HGW-Deltaproteobacteria-22]
MECGHLGPRIPRRRAEPRDGFAAAGKKTRWQAPAVHMKQPRDGCAAAGKKSRCQGTAVPYRKAPVRYRKAA